MPEADENEEGVGGAAITILVILTTLNLLILVWGVPMSQKMYQDDLPGKPLPSVTLFVIYYRFGLAFANAMIVMIVGLCAALRDANARWLTYYGLVWNALQVGFVGWALYLPTVGTM
jgi:hypothetical protein